ncbi:hypothetical protein [Janthinobacterium sp. PSPC1-1]|uniref:hypothetical protein n=1 Tax=Janthinobacterium sp. PSPC1-1 TaxID=2804581 RepID=UPI003CEC635D
MVEFDGSGDNPWDEHGRLELAVLFVTNNAAAVESVVRKVEFRRARVNPRIQLVPFLLGAPYLVDFAKQVLEKIVPSSVRGTGDAHFQFLSKNAVAKILNISMSHLAQAIKLGVIPWPSVGGRMQRIATEKIEAALFWGDEKFQIAKMRTDKQGPKAKLKVQKSSLSVRAGARRSLREGGGNRGRQSDPPLPGNGISFASTAELLAVSEREISKLVKHGWLRQVEHRGSEPCVSKKSLAALQLELQRPDQLPLAAAANLLGRSATWLKGSWARCGIVRINHLHLWQFVSMADLELVERLRTNWMSTAQTAVALGIRFEHVQTAVSLKIIKAIPVVARPGCVVYERTAVRQLTRDYGKDGVSKLVREMGINLPDDQGWG